jgi:hypothetical protein
MRVHLVALSQWLNTGKEEARSDRGTQPRSLKSSDHVENEKTGRKFCAKEASQSFAESGNLRRRGTLVSS